MEFKKDNKEVIKDVVSYLKEYFAKNNQDETEVWIGSDSEKRRGKLAEYAIVICLYKVGKGAHVIHKKIHKKIVGSGNDVKSFVRKRLWSEVEYSLEVAEYLRQRGLLKRGDDSSYYKPIWSNAKKFVIHIDFNGKAQFDSNPLYDSAIWECRMHGYECVTKPDGFAATYAADHLL